LIVTPKGRRENLAAKAVGTFGFFRFQPFGLKRAARR
jgi:hypothetical protein